MATPETIFGLGLMVAGVGFPGGIAMLRLWPAKSSNGNGESCDRKHDRVKMDLKELFESKLSNVDSHLKAQKDAIDVIAATNADILKVVLEKRDRSRSGD